MTGDGGKGRWLVTGAAGMLGQEVLAELQRHGIETAGLSRAELDITDPAAVRSAVEGAAIVVNCAGWTDVDGAETAEEAAAAVNGTGVRILAAACAATGARLLQISTDYVLPGDASEPYAEDAATGPVNAYGRSKLIGERAVAELLPQDGYVVRTAWLYGEHGPNFVATMLKLAAQRDTLDVVDDQQGQPTWSVALARQLVELGHAALDGRAPAGVYHATAGGATTWFGLAREVYRLCGLDPERIRPTTSESFVRPAVRPAFSVLAHDHWAQVGLAPMSDWREQLADALATPGFTALARTARDRRVR
ncbi:dTDP-4-dehydrorhamnose reductase [Streptomyces sp. NBC_01264]|uniref:dTDP-4-dehydrorhamnose reductase n=1 Tax=Streptomyces sp. NBC_01264 TaxID=2903804 RepID=UPI0022506472|nr:dTDP-4-dehydrorhamnose reductase [Streptomyces sp. NBC_01264]MCX4780429.1 dTDP-4-dehydrorhamnose reductase [Streptomyces sp. NBC_01264]